LSQFLAVSHVDSEIKYHQCIIDSTATRALPNQKNGRKTSRFRGLRQGRSAFHRALTAALEKNSTREALIVGNVIEVPAWLETEPDPAKAVLQESGYSRLVRWTQI